MEPLQPVEAGVVQGLLGPLLARDGWHLANGPLSASGPGARQIRFFLAGEPVEKIQQQLKQLAEKDAGQFQELGVVVVADAADLRWVRDNQQADLYPRAFFLALEELQALAAGNPILRASKPGNISAVAAEIVANRRIGPGDSSHYVLTFRAPEIREIWPAQFVMMDCTPERFLLSPRQVQEGADWEEPLYLPSFPLLKRPFGIQRAYYRHFDRLYQKQLALPPALALALHTVYPHQFDMLYKVLPGGSGTPLLARLQPGDTVHMLGPLGSPYDVRRLRRDGCTEVHVIGGGVGVAPLILLVQALRYYSIPVKVFIGMASVELLKYRGDVEASFQEQARDAYVYIDDLLEAGVAAQDIYLASDNERPAPVRGLPPANLFHGLVPEQYRQHLAGTERSPRTVAFTCGPDRMMEAVHQVSAAAGLALNCLMEKRMGCGYGVCLSCVCKVRDPAGGHRYDRVCTEGPVFDASQLIWKENVPPTSSKPASATCGCAPRC